MSLQQTTAKISPEEYERDLKQRQEEHIRKVTTAGSKEWKPCLHEQCQDCIGTGIKLDGSVCIHYISCDCPKCRRDATRKTANFRVKHLI